MATVYMIVTRDKYRLPRWWGTTTAELAQLSGRKYQNVRVGICKAFRHGGSPLMDVMWCVWLMPQIKGAQTVYKPLAKPEGRGK